jgi:hypothetical protein
MSDFNFGFDIVDDDHTQAKEFDFNTLMQSEDIEVELLGKDASEEVCIVRKRVSISV